jgi:hypothetical protein
MGRLALGLALGDSEVSARSDGLSSSNGADPLLGDPAAAKDEVETARWAAWSE